MASNTKLTKEQKQDLKTIKMEVGDKLGFGRSFSGRVTVACNRVNSELVRFATSVASPDENKIRRKVGEYNALTRLMADESALAVFHVHYWDNLDMVAEEIASRLAG